MPPVGVAPADKGGGTDTYVRTFLQAAQTAGHSVDVVTLAPSGEVWPPPRNVRIFYVRSALLRGLLFHFREAKSTVANALLLVATSVAIAARAIRLAFRGNYDIVYAVGGPIAASSAFLIKIFTRLPTAVHFHWAYHLRSARRPMRWLARHFYDRFDLIIGNSRLMAEDTLAIGVTGPKCTWVYNWVDQAFFRPLQSRAQLRETWDLPPERFLFLYVGRFDELKQVDRIANVLQCEQFDATFLFVGDGRLRESVQRTSRLNDVRIISTMPPEKLDQLYNLAECLLWGSVDVDYPSLVVMEAMSCGLPVITTNETQNFMYPGMRVEKHMLGDSLSKLYPPTKAGISLAITEAIHNRFDMEARRPDVRQFATAHFGKGNAERLLHLLASIKDAGRIGTPRVSRKNSLGQMES